MAKENNVTPFEKAWRATGRAEGGYVDDPSDSGGETNHGITVAVARAQGYTGPMRELTAERAEEIAKGEYWDVMRLDDIAVLDVDIAMELFDTGFNTGTKRAVRFLQRALNALNRGAQDYGDVDVDGRLGGQSLLALRSYLMKRKSRGKTVMLRALNSLQGAFYVQLVERREKDEKFLYGWLLHRVIV